MHQMCAGLNGLASSEQLDPALLGLILPVAKIDLHIAVVRSNESNFIGNDNSENT